MSESYVTDPHLELVNDYEKLMCSIGYKYKQFKTLKGRYKIKHDVYVPTHSKGINFNVYYKENIIYCAIVITPVNDLFLMYQYNNNIEIRKILSASSVKRFIATLKKYGNLNSF